MSNRTTERDGEADAVRRHRPLRSNALVESDGVREVENNGRSYLVFPLIPAQEMVLNYPEHGTDELLAAERLRETVDMWAGTPLTYIHPENAQRTANSPDSYTGEVIGEAHHPEIVNGTKLRVEGWVDVEKANAIGGLAAEVVAKLRSNAELSVSAGYATIGDTRVNGTFQGTAYDIEQGTIIPDHIAVFPSDAFQARCSPEDGCAAPRANAVSVPSPAQAEPVLNRMSNELTDEHARTLGRRMLDALGLSTDESQTCNCHSTEECGCGSPTTNAESASASNNDDDADDGDNAEPDASTADADASDDADGAADADTDAADVSDGEDTDGDSDHSTDADATSDSDSDDDAAQSDTMSDHDIDSLAEQSAFDAATLGEWDDEELTALSETVSTQPEPTTTDEPTDADADADADDGLAAEDVAELKENFAQLQETVESLREDKANAEKQSDARIVANALDLEVEQALEMNEETLSTLAEQHADEQTTVNYGAVPGGVDRTPDASDADDYPAGGRTAWEQRSGGD